MQSRAEIVAVADGDARVEPRHVRLLDVEPELGRGAGPEELAAACRHTVAPVVAVPPGELSPASLRDSDERTGAFAAVVLSGLIARDVVLGDRAATQLVGPGDVISLAEWDDGIPLHTEWRVAEASELAVLDHRFLAAAQRWPWLTARLVERAARWADRAAALQAITQLGRVDLRLVALLWHLSDRWGRVCADGVVLPLRLTHETLGRLVGAQRPTVTLALRDLRESGAVTRRGNGWLLSRDSRALLEPQHGAVAPAEIGDGDTRLRRADDVVARADAILAAHESARDDAARAPTRD